jgi:cytochrome c oxidase cbb3-type subunit 3
MSKAPAQPPEPPLRPHVYDGIREYDNRLPNWWLWTFYIAIIFSVLYWFSWYDTRVMPGDEQLIDRELARIEEIRLAAVGDLSSETLWQMSRNPGFVASGRIIYQDKCQVCHGASLEGGIGLSLVDGRWRWGNTPMSIFRVVSDGSPDRSAGMQAWIGELGTQKVSQVTAFILSHHSADAMAGEESENPPLAL